MHLCLGPVALDRGGRGAHLYGMPPSPRHLSLTADHVAQVFRDVPDPGDSPLHTPMTDGEKAELAQRLLDDLDGAPFWLFAYGSLIWNSGFDVARSEIATLDGFARSFCMWSVHYRGTEEVPGLVLGLDAQPGATCRGMALAVAEGQEAQTLAYLRERELTASAYREYQVPLRLNTGETVTALTYVVDPDHALYCGGMTAEDQARVIARAAGNRGPNADYLHNTVAHLTQIGIDDSGLSWLAARVKELHA